MPASAAAAVRATFRRKKPENWLAAVDRNAHGIESEEVLAPATQAVEALLMGLRLDEGVDLARIKTLGGGLPLDESAVSRLMQQGLLTCTGDRLAVTDTGMPVLEAILREIVR